MTMVSRRVLQAGAAGLAGLMLLETALWWGGVTYLKHRVAALHSRTGCSLVSQRQHAAGWPFSARLRLEPVRVQCELPSSETVVGTIGSVSVELAPWHPASVHVRLEGGEVWGMVTPPETASPLNPEERKTPIQPAVRVVARRDGAPLRLSFPLRYRQRGRLDFQTDFTRLVGETGHMMEHSVTARGVAGYVVWNTEASPQSSALAVSLQARQAVVAPWPDMLNAVDIAVAVPGPAKNVGLFWQALAGTVARPPSSLVAEVPSKVGGPLPFEPNLLVQHVAAQWRGLKAVWSAKLVLPAEGGAAGESWLTLTNWRLLVNDLTEHRILSPQQAAFLNRVSDHVEQKQGTPDGPLMVPLPVREGQVQLGGISVDMLFGLAHKAMEAQEQEQPPHASPP
ncbi:DUF2125 domain-containing protein [Acetobacter senegalensis]|uniref:DUF2125 domain-containing protein n=1 Tax=Acetobacter senegalensis TaxID=446692 RepID=UPI0020A1343B|nr:DUF2125 domain-containing protein [Acetobacter senegalensis]MCP1196160.1 DUF2125 domain-containing protein [Acetobacter senegalensis]